MRTLQQHLASISDYAAKNIPQELRDVMHKRTEDLSATGQAQKATTVGDTAPSFELPDSTGTLVRSQDLLAKGPLVLTFFRGHW
ncbi:MAG: hypothetical protein AAGF11_14215 [Myxococcota bacterium]